MSASKRVRAVANHDVSVHDYKDVICKWFDSFEGAVTSFIGPGMCREQRFVTAAHVVRTSGVLQGFLDGGLTNGVILGNRLQAGIRHALASRPDKGGKGCNADLLAHDLSEHLRYCFNVVRYMKQEATLPNPNGNSKVATLARHAKTSELVVINSLMAKIEVQESTGCLALRVPSLGRSASMNSSPASSPPSTPRERGLHKAS